MTVVGDSQSVGIEMGEGSIHSDVMVGLGKVDVEAGIDIAQAIVQRDVALELLSLDFAVDLDILECMLFPDNFANVSDQCQLERTLRVDVCLIVEIEDGMTKLCLPGENPVELETIGLAMPLHGEWPVRQRILVRVRLVVFEVGIEHSTSDIGRKIAFEQCPAGHALD